MTKTITSSVPGNKGIAMLVSKNLPSNNEVYIRRSVEVGAAPRGIVYTPWEAYQFILAVAEEAGMKFEPTAAGTGIILQAPEDSKLVGMREDASVVYFSTDYKYLESDQRRIVDRLVELEALVGKV